MEFVEVAQPEVVVDMPVGGQVIHVAEGGTQGGRVPTVSIWVVGDDAGPMAPRRFAVVFTGQPAPLGTHRGTFISGPYVHHVFEVA